jgi:prepilin-type N-terminal cleavage/methylation domain-containing protein
MRRSQRGFTLIEVLVALVVFAISVVGLVALESRSIEAQKAAANLREGERVAQETMAQLQAKSFLELITRDFAGTVDPSFPYTDDDTTAPIANFRRPPADLPTTTSVPGSVTGQYKVFRTVDWVFDANDAPPNPPVGVPDKVRALQLEVLVLWADETDPTYPAGSTLGTAYRTDQLQAAWAGDPSYPWVGYVRLRTVRVNDAVLDVTPLPGP